MINLYKENSFLQNFFEERFSNIKEQWLEFCYEPGFFIPYASNLDLTYSLAAPIYAPFRLNLAAAIVASIAVLAVALFVTCLAYAACVSLFGNREKASRALGGASSCLRFFFEGLIEAPLLTILALASFPTIILKISTRGLANLAPYSPVINEEIGI